MPEDADWEVVGDRLWVVRGQHGGPLTVEVDGQRLLDGVRVDATQISAGHMFSITNKADGGRELRRDGVRICAALRGAGDRAVGGRLFTMEHDGRATLLCDGIPVLHDLLVEHWTESGGVLLLRTFASDGSRSCVLRVAVTTPPA